ncbi:MAG: HAMP domain-containing sensor histidine kinase [Patescibacteria group bacterium]
MESGEQKKPRSELKPYFHRVSFIESIGVKIFFMLLCFSLVVVIIVIGYFSGFFESEKNQLLQEVLKFLNIELVPVLPVIIILSALMAFFLSRYVTKPIRDAMQALTSVSEGQTHVDIASTRQDELGNLILILNATLRKLREAQQHAEDVSDMKSNFVTVAAHQLRTPSTGVKWALDILAQDQNMSTDSRNLIDQSKVAVNQIVTIVNDLLNSAKEDNPIDGYSFKPINIIELINASIAGETLRAREKNVQIAFHNTTYEQEIMLNLDKSKIGMALTNLFDNAVRYNRPNGFVEITLTKDTDTVDISIKDNGIGIPPNEQGRIFSQFYRAANAVSAEPNGSGIGLFMTKNAVEQHQGKIWFETEEGVGTVFHIVLPLPAKA